MFISLSALLFALCCISSAQNTECALCVNVIDHVEAYLKTNGTVASIQKVLEEVCTQLPSEYQSQCQTFQQELPLLVFWLESHSSREFCAVAQLCPPVKRLHALPKGQNYTQCSLCDTVITYADNWLQRNGSLTQLEATLKLVCGALPEPYKDQCFVLLEELPQILMMMQSVPPAELCAEIGLCPKPPQFIAAVVRQVIAPKINYTECSVCETVILYAKEFLAGNGTIAQLEQVMGFVCTALPAQYKPECQKIAQVLPQIVNNIRTKQPHQVCQSLAFCPPTLLPKVKYY